MQLLSVKCSIKYFWKGLSEKSFAWEKVKTIHSSLVKNMQTLIILKQCFFLKNADIFLSIREKLDTGFPMHKYLEYSLNMPLYHVMMINFCILKFLI